MGLLAGVGADMASLVLETMEGLVAERALVGPGEVLAGFFLSLLLGVLQQGRHEAHGGSSHRRGWRGCGGGGGGGWSGCSGSVGV